MEILLVVAILGIVAVMTVFAVRGVDERGAQRACAGDDRTLTTAADSYMARESLAEVPALGSSGDRLGLFLVNVGMIKQVSTYFDLAADGTVSTTGEPCP